MARSRWRPVAGQVDVATVRARLDEYVLADAHERVLLPECVLVNLSVVAVFEEELLGDERLCLLPDLRGCVGDEPRFRSLRDVLFVVQMNDVVWRRNTLIMCQVDEFGCYPPSTGPPRMAYISVSVIPISNLSLPPISMIPVTTRNH